MKTLPVTVLSGLPGAGKTSVLNHVLSHCGDLRVAVIMNSMGKSDSCITPHEGLNVADNPGDRLIQISTGCICCTVREDLLVEVAELARNERFDYLLIESAGISEPFPVAETFAFVDENGDSLSEAARLDTMVTVVDAATFLENYQSIEELRDRGLGVDGDDDRDVARLLVDQIEFANVILLNKTDLVPAAEVGFIMAVLRRLNPDAHILSIQHGQVPWNEILNTGRFGMDPDGDSGAPHVAVDRDEDETADEFGVSRFHYRARRPFHPRRYWDFWMESQEAPGILRSEGYFWLATRHAMSGYWSQTGQVLAAEPGGPWWAETPRELWSSDDPHLIRELDTVWDEIWGDRRQELVIVSHNISQTQVRDALDACLLTDAELASGPSSWTDLEDPFAPWQSEDDHPHDAC